VTRRLPVTWFDAMTPPRRPRRSPLPPLPRRPCLRRRRARLRLWFQACRRAFNSLLQLSSIYLSPDPPRQGGSAPTLPDLGSSGVPLYFCSFVRGPRDTYLTLAQAGVPLHSTRMELEDIPFQILQEITNNFSEERKLGEGSFGDVYRVTSAHA